VLGEVGRSRNHCQGGSNTDTSASLASARSSRLASRTFNASPAPSLVPLGVNTPRARCTYSRRLVTDQFLEFRLSRNRDILCGGGWGGIGPIIGPLVGIFDPVQGTADSRRMVREARRWPAAVTSSRSGNLARRSSALADQPLRPERPGCGCREPAAGMVVIGMSRPTLAAVVAGRPRSGPWQLRDDCLRNRSDHLF